MHDESRVWIHHIAEHPEHISTLAQWFRAEWAYLSPTMTLEVRALELEAKQSKTLLPMTLIAMQEKALVGTYSLDLEDMDTHPHLSPWLASVYVDENSRGKGIGRLLIEDALSRARALGIPRLYLFTPDQAAWYETFGWRRIEATVYFGQAVTIMEIEIRRTD